MIKDRDQDEDKINYGALSAHEFKVREMEQQVCLSPFLRNSEHRRAPPIPRMSQSLKVCRDIDGHAASRDQTLFFIAEHEAIEGWIAGSLDSAAFLLLHMLISSFLSAG